MSDDAARTLEAILILFVTGAVTVAANLADRDRNAALRQAVVASLFALNLGIVALLGLPGIATVLAPETFEVDVPSREAAWVAFVLSILIAAVGVAVLSHSARARLAALFPRAGAASSNPPPSNAGLSSEPARAPLEPDRGAEPLFPQMLNYYTKRSPFAPERAPLAAMQPAPLTRGFNPASTVHMVALALSIMMLGVQLVNFVAGGGLEGIAQVYEEGVSALSILLSGIPFVVVPALGVGLRVRRSLPRVLDRLGLNMPTAQSMAVAVAVTIALFAYVTLVALIWQALVSEETFEEQTRASDALSASVDTLFLALVVAATAAIGEEIAFRGALQPIFGLWPTAVLFTVTHMQYTLTPAALIIFGVALVFGWLRRRYNTTVAIAVHFLYNFIPLAVSAVAGEEALFALLWWLE